MSTKYSVQRLSHLLHSILLQLPKQRDRQVKKLQSLQYQSAIQPVQSDRNH
nr:hypothetical protein [Pseudanabaena sp. lw0831]